MSTENLYQTLKRQNRPSNLIRGLFSMELDKMLEGKNALDLGAGVRK